MWDEEKKSLLEKNQSLEEINQRNGKRLEDYRRKLLWEFLVLENLKKELTFCIL